LAEELVQRSGLGELRSVLAAQLGARADALKARSALILLRRTLTAHPVSGSPALLGAAELRAITVEALASALDMPVETLTGAPPAPAAVYPEPVSQAMVVRDAPGITLREAMGAIEHQTGIARDRLARLIADAMAEAHKGG
jgi:hypothetical protein